MSEKIPKPGTRAVHELKTWPHFFDAVARGAKTFEIRENDRGFQTGDKMVLRKYDPDAGVFSGDEITTRITYVLAGPYLVPGFVALGFEIEGWSISG